MAERSLPLVDSVADVQPHAHGFGFWDAMLVAAARAAGVTRLLTEDMQDGRRVGAMRLENPFKADFALGLD